MAVFVLSLAVLGMSTVSCDKSVDGKADRRVIVPLAIGNTWYMTQTTYDSAGNVISSDLYTREITDTVRIDGNIWFQLDSSYVYFANRSDGLWAWTPLPILSSSHDNELGYLANKYPASVGEVYRYNPIPLWDDYAIKVTVLSTDTTIQVPQGSYHCYCYFYEMSPSGEVPYIPLEMHDYLSPDMGWIKSHMYYDTQSGMRYLKVVTELDSLKLMN